METPEQQKPSRAEKLALELRSRVETVWQDALGHAGEPGETIRPQRPDNDDTIATKSRNASALVSTLHPRRQRVSERGARAEIPPEYELLHEIGKGGMGVVFCARQTSVDRDVALKMMLGDVAPHDTSRDQFLAEAAVMAHLDHPNIVPIYEVAESGDGTLFYTMKEVRGTPWRNVMGELSQAENLDILLRVADAVAFAHSRGVIHRDLKPDNVMLGDFGETLLVDWGLAAAVTATARAPRLEGSYVLGGTPRYMAPEMAAGDAARISVASDIYLLGAILFEVLTGDPPHPGEHTTDVLLNAATNRICETDKRGELKQIALTAMATLPEDRYADARAFQAAIRAYQSHAESSALALAAAGHLAQARGSGQYDDFSQAQFAYREALTMWPENVDAQQGLDATRMAYATAATGRGDFDLAEQLLDGDAAGHATLLAQIRAARMERDTRRRRVQTLTRAAQGLATAITVVLLVAFAWIRKERETALKERDHAIAAEGVANVARAAEARQADAARAAMRLARKDSYAARIQLAQKRIERSDWAGAKELLEMCPPELRHWEWGWLMRRVRTSYVALPPYPGMVAGSTFSPDGRMLIAGGAERGIVVWDVASAAPVARYGRTLGGEFTPFFRDGTLLATAGWNDKVVMVDAASPARRFTLEFEPPGGRNVSVSDDGKLLFVGSKVAGDVGIYDTATGKLLRELKGRTTGTRVRVLTPDGRWLAASGAGGGTISLWDLESGTYTEHKVHGHNIRGLQFANKGRWLISGSSLGELKVHAFPAMEQIFAARPTTAAIYGLAAGGNDRLTRVLTADWEGTVVLTDLPGGHSSTLARGSQVNTLAVSADGLHGFTGHTDGRAQLWKLDNPSAFDAANAWDFRGFSTDGQVALYMHRRTPVLMDLNTNEKREGVPLELHPDHITAWALSRDRRRLVIARRSGLPRTMVLDMEKRAVLWEDRREGELPISWLIDFSADATWLAALNGKYIEPNRKLELYRAEDGNAVAVPMNLATGTTAFAFHPTMTDRLLLGRRNGSVSEWSIPGWVRIAEQAAHSDIVTRLRFSQNGRHLISTSRDRRTLLRAWPPGESQTVVMQNGQIPLDAHTSRDGQRVAIEYGHGQASIWAIDPPRELVTFSGAREGFLFCSEDRRLVAGTTQREHGAFRADAWRPTPMTQRLRAQLLFERGDTAGAAERLRALAALGTQQEVTAELARHVASGKSDKRIRDLFAKLPVEVHDDEQRRLRDQLAGLHNARQRRHGGDTINAADWQGEMPAPHETSKRN